MTSPQLFSQRQPTKLLFNIPVLLVILVFIINSSGDHVFNKTNTFKLGLLAIACLVLIVAYFWKQHKFYIQPKLNKSFFVLLFLPVLATIPGLCLSEGKYSYAFGLEVTSQLLCILWCFLIYSILDLRAQVYIFWKLFTVVILYVCMVGFLEKAGLNPLLRLSINPFESYWAGDSIGFNGFPSRIKSTFGNINYFAAWLIQLIPIYVAFAIIKANKAVITDRFNWMKLLGCIGIVTLLLTSLALTGTRAAILASIVSIVLFYLGYVRLFTRTPALKITVQALVVLCLISGFILLLNPDFFIRIQALLNISAWEGRLIPWQAAYNSILQAPFFGYGLGSSYQLFFEFASPDRGLLFSEPSYNHVHFEWLEVLQEGGLVGFLAYCLFWFYIFVLGARYVCNKANQENDRVLMLGLLSGLLAYHVHGLFSVAPRMIVVRSMAYMLVAFIFILSIRSNISSWVKPKTSNKSHYRVLNLAVVLLIMCCSVWLSYYSYGQYQFSKGLAIEYQRPNYLTDLAMSSQDVYVLDKASYILAEEKNAQGLKVVSETLGGVFQNYRNNLYFQAYSSYLNSDFQKANYFLERHQEKDRYNSESNRLLTSISLLQGEGDLFRRQLKLEIIIAACKAKILVPCVAESVVIHEGEMMLPIQFSYSRNKLNVFLNSELFIELSELVRLGKINSQAAIIDYSKSMARKIGNSKYFIPSVIHNSSMKTRNILGDFIEGDKLQATLSDSLNRNSSTYSGKSLFEEVNSYLSRQETLHKDLNDAAIALAEARAILELEINVDDFMRKRVFLNHLIQWLVTSITLSAIDAES